MQRCEKCHYESVQITKKLCFFRIENVKKFGRNWIRYASIAWPVNQQELIFPHYFYRFSVVLTYLNNVRTTLWSAPNHSRSIESSKESKSPSVVINFESNPKILLLVSKYIFHHVKSHVDEKVQFNVHQFTFFTIFLPFRDLVECVSQQKRHLIFGP